MKHKFCIVMTFHSGDSLDCESTGLSSTREPLGHNRLVGRGPGSAILSISPMPDLSRTVRHVFILTATST